MMTPEYDEEHFRRRYRGFWRFLNISEIVWTFLGFSLAAFLLVLAVQFWIDLGRMIYYLF